MHNDASTIEFVLKTIKLAEVNKLSILNAIYEFKFVCTLVKYLWIFKFFFGLLHFCVNW